MNQGFFILFLAILFFSGCAVKQPQPKETLKKLLVSLGTTEGEAQTLEIEAYRKTSSLKSNYGSNLPPVLHNTFVNLGIKQRGLCWHYAHDLYDHLAPLTKNLDAIIVVAHLGSWAKEHSALVLTCHGCSIDKGVVLDAWRNNKKLIYLRVKEDRYPWRPR